MVIVIEVEIEGVGDLLREARKKAGLTQIEWAQKIDRYRLTVMKWETDQRAPVSYKLLLEIEELLGAEIVSREVLLKAIAQLLGAEEVQGITFRMMR